MKFNVITIFPDIITDYCNESILGRGQKQGVMSVNAIDLRDFSDDPHRKVDDTPYGGGPGMVMKPEPIYKALASLGALTSKHQNIKTLKQAKNSKVKIQKEKKTLRTPNSERRTILLSPRGRQFDERLAEEWATLDEITFVCGRYEGIDQRVSDIMVDEEVSIGPYVLAGGELGALIVIEAVARLIPGVLGNPESLKEETDFRLQTSDSFSTKKRRKSEVRLAEVSAEYPQYTKPADFLGLSVPEILLSGDHKKIEDWRKHLPHHLTT